jgi:predicted secreted protein
MPTTGTVLAKNMAFYTGSTTPVLITCQTNASLSQTTNMFETTCKDAGAWGAQQPGVKNWTASGEGLLAFSATNGYTVLWDAWNNQTAVSIVFQTGVTGDTKFSGTGYISSLELTSNGNDEAVTFSFEITGSGALAKATT